MLLQAIWLTSCLGNIPLSLVRWLVLVIYEANIIMTSPAVIVFCVGVIVQTAAMAPSSIYGGACRITLMFWFSERCSIGRFITGLGVGSLSMAVPLYNAEIAPPEVRGSLVALQQLAITFGIMVSFWIDYGTRAVISPICVQNIYALLGTNFIGGSSISQKEAAWRLPLALQLVPAVILGVGILFMPFSPRYVVFSVVNLRSCNSIFLLYRWLVNQGRDDEALVVLSRARGAPPDSDLVQLEFL